MTDDPNSGSGREPLHPAPPPTEDAATDAAKIEEAKIKRVEEISALARSAWFSLLAALAFSAVTLLSIGHVDVLLDSQMIELPVVSIPVPTRLFLTLGAVALTVLYLNVHLYLSKLWRAFHHAPGDRIYGKDDPRNWRLADHIPPWTVNDYALSLKHDCNPRDRARRFWRNLVTFATVWLATPVVLGWMWCKSLLLREPTVTFPILACLAFVLLFGSHSWLVAHRQLEKEARHPRRVLNLGSLAAGVVLGLTGYATWAAFEPSFTETAREAGRHLNLDRQDVAGVTGAIPAAAIQREEYRQKWCGIVDVPLDLCGKGRDLSDFAMIGLTVARKQHCIEKNIATGMRRYRTCKAYFRQLDARFQSDWMDVRRDTLTKVARIDLEKMDLAGMSAADADLTRAMLEGADLSWSSLPRASLEGAALKTANLEHAEAHHANLTLADLTATRLPDVNLKGAVLEGAIMYGADLRDADLRDADLTAANLRGVDLTGADMKGARLARADLAGAILSDADLRRVAGLTNGQLADAVGSGAKFTGSRTLDDDGNYADQHFGIEPCWVALPARVMKIVADYPDLKSRYAAHMCAEDPAAKTVPRSSPIEAPPSGTGRDAGSFASASGERSQPQP